MIREFEKTDQFLIDPVRSKGPSRTAEVAPIPLNMPLVEGDLGSFGDYRILRLIGRGSAGAVFHAIDPTLDRDAAIKILAPKVAGKRIRERFLREARACAKVRNDFVVSIHKTGECNGLPFIEMEFLRGMPLDLYLRKHKHLRYAQLLRLGREISTGLAAVHEIGIVHRDVKPGNIWLEAPNGKAKLLDFGLATSEETTNEALTLFGTVVGTPAYMSPEQARGQRVDPRSDLFSLGVVLYHTACGELPFPGKTPIDVISSIVSREPIPLHERNATIPERFAKLVHRLLAKDPAKRPSSAKALFEELKALTPIVTVPIPLSDSGGEPGTTIDPSESSTSDNWATATAPSNGFATAPQIVAPIRSARNLAVWVTIVMLWVVAAIMLIDRFRR